MRTGKWLNLIGLVLMVWLLVGCMHSGGVTGTDAVVHVVLIQFKPEVTGQQREQVINASLERLKDIPGVVSVAAGPKVRDDRPVHIRDYDVGILVVLDSVAALDRYGPHPLHQAFVQEFQPLFARLQVVDFAPRGDSAP